MKTFQKRGDPSQDVYYYRPLHIWAKCLGILPNFDINRLDEYHGPFLNGIVMACIFTGIYLHTTYGKLTYMKNALQPSDFVTNVGGDIALVMSNVMSIIRLSLFKAKQICKFLKLLKGMDVELRSMSKTLKYPRKQFLAEFVLANLLFVIYYVYDAYIWVTSVTWQTYRWFYLRDVQCFHLVILSLVVRNYSLAIKNRVSILNEMLVDMHPNQQPQIIDVMSVTEIATVNKSNARHGEMELLVVQRMRRIFAQVCNSIMLFNDIFGWVYLVLYVSIVAYILTAANIALVYGVGGKKIGKADFGWPLIILCVLWASLPMCVGFFIFASAERVFYEIKKTPILCYSVIDEWTSNDPTAVVIPELERLAQQVTNSHPEITAAGFFTVNYAIFFSLIGSLSSYFIVLIQFM